jgi:hypothetical protein
MMEWNREDSDKKRSSSQTVLTFDLSTNSENLE